MTIAIDLGDAIRARVAEQLSRPVEQVTLDLRLEDLAVDSIDLIEVAIDIQEEHDVWFDESDFASVETIGDLVALVERRRREVGEA